MPRCHPSSCPSPAAHMSSQRPSRPVRGISRVICASRTANEWHRLHSCDLLTAPQPALMMSITVISSQNRILNQRTLKFADILPSSSLFGTTIAPRCTAQLRTTCAGDIVSLSATTLTLGSVKNAVDRPTHFFIEGHGPSW